MAETSNNNQGAKVEQPGFIAQTKAFVEDGAKALVNDTIAFAEDVRAECFDPDAILAAGKTTAVGLSKFVYLPYFPAFHRPGWMLRYIVGPHTPELMTNLFTDFVAGITVALTLVPQGLSYATLAGLPAINGLYCAVLPAAIYSFFGSSMQLCVGPVALVSLLMGELISNYNITAGSEESVQFAGEVSVAVGIILILIGLLNLGDLIRFISHPVMSGFTTSAAMLIGQNQLKAAFGFITSVPQAGQEGYEWNWQVMRWFWHHFDDVVPGTKTWPIHHDAINPYARRICFGLYFSMMFFVVLKQWIKPTPERKKSLAFNIWTIFVNVLPFVAIIIGAHIAYEIKSDIHGLPLKKQSFYKNKLSIVKSVTPGLDFIKAPSFHWPFGKLMGDVFPLALIAYMESYSVAQRVASINKQVHLLNASQELFAMGCANFLAAVSSAYPVTGSFSRSSLNQAAGACTPVSKLTTMIAIVITLRYLTDTFYYIPNAALAAVIWVAIYNLVSMSDFYEAWKYSKKDFFVMLVTAVTVYVTTTGVGLAVGIGLSVFVALVDQVFNPVSKLEHVQAVSASELEQERLNKEAKKDLELAAAAAHEKDPTAVVHFRYRVSLSFLTVGQFIDEVQVYTTQASRKRIEQAAKETDSWNERVFHQVSSWFDRTFFAFKEPAILNTDQEITPPRAIVLDIAATTTIDLTALKTIEEQAHKMRTFGIKFVIINVSDDIAALLKKFGFHNDDLRDANISVAEADYFMSQAHHIIPLKKPVLSVKADYDEVNRDSDDLAAKGEIELVLHEEKGGEQSV